MPTDLAAEQQKSSSLLSFGKLIESLTEPEASIQEIEQRSLARLLASLLIAFIPSALLSILVQLISIPEFERIFPVLLGSLFVLLFAYILSRTSYYQIGALITIALPAIAVSINVVVYPEETDTLFFMIISVMLSSVMLPWRWTISIVIVVLLLPVGLLFSVPELTLPNLITPWGFSIITSGLILVLTKFRNTLETNRQSELALNESRWRMLISQSPLSIVVYSLNGRPQNFNQAAIDLWNLAPQDLEFVMGQYNILEDEQLEANGVLPNIRAGFTGNPTVTNPTKYAFQRQEVDGSTVRDTRWIVTHCYPVKNESGKVSEVVLIHEDVTERKEAEELIQKQERLAAVGQLAAGISHDFNNIMAVITLYSEILLKSSNLQEKEKRQLQTIRQQANRAAALTTQILDFSRQSMMERQPIDLLYFVKEFTELMKRTLPENIKIYLSNDSEIYIIFADSTRIQQAFMNLTLNARDAMPNGGELRIELELVQMQPGEPPLFNKENSEEWVKVTVADNGVGISHEVFPNIFDPFFTTKAADQGIGLGLAQVYGIVQQHDGHIYVESVVDVGTTFTIYLPAVSGVLPISEPSSKPFDRGNGETILVVEDNFTTQAALASSLELLNYVVLRANNGLDALSVLDEHQDRIKLILSDFMMPEMGGKELVNTLKQREIFIPVVLLSGHALGKEIEMMRGQGLRGWLQKPPTLDKLAEIVAQILDDA